jgi:hypothetical protein
MRAERNRFGAAFMAAALCCITTSRCAGQWSGYEFSAPSGTTVNSVQATWTVPAVNASRSPPNAWASLWVGIDGWGSGTLEQIGVYADTANNGAPGYEAWYEMYPNGAVGIPMLISAGDTVTASVQYLASSGLFQMSIIDLSRANDSYTNDFSPVSGTSPSRSSGEWMVEAPTDNGILPLPEFGVANFTGASASLSNGASGPISTFPYDSIGMGATSSGLGATPSPLNATGSGFSVATTWPGDVNSDGRVDINDLTIVLANFGKTTGMWWATGDLTGDGRVDVNDLTLVLANFGSTLGTSGIGAAAVPEPSIPLLLGVAAAGLFAYTRRQRTAENGARTGPISAKWELSIRPRYSTRSLRLPVPGRPADR